MRYLALILILCTSAFAETYKVQSTLRPSAEISITCHGNAFAVTKNTAVTCAHVLADTGENRIQVKGEWHAVKILRKDAANDLCLVQLGADILTPVEFAPEPAVAVIGSERAREIKTHEVAVIGGSLRSAFSVGISGSPVLADGKLIGMVVTVDSYDKPTRSSFVASAVIRKFVEGR